LAQLVVLGDLNFLSCRNVDVAEPVRPRPERRRIARTGTRIHEIIVRPAGSSTRSRGNTGIPVGAVPLTSVRGHFAHYGPDYGKGLLFGRHAGRFWIPAHIRGTAEVGEDIHTYRLQPERSSP
jgi:hypothetical protein